MPQPAVESLVHGRGRAHIAGLGADKGYDQKELVRGLREHRVTPHVAIALFFAGQAPASRCCMPMSTQRERQHYPRPSTENQRDSHREADKPKRRYRPVNQEQESEHNRYRAVQDRPPAMRNFRRDGGEQMHPAHYQEENASGGRLVRSSPGCRLAWRLPDR